MRSKDLSRQVRPGRAAKRRAFAKTAGLIVFAAVVSVSMGTGLSAQAEPDAELRKSETVFVILEDDGSYTSATVVNSFSGGGPVTDYGEYTAVTNLMGDELPQIDGDAVYWSAQAMAGSEIFYYQGETDKSLPVTFDISYTLNGEPASPEQIAGKSGELKITVHAENHAATGETDEALDKAIYTPFAVQTSFALDAGVFTVLDTPSSATTLRAGESITVSYASFPLPEDEFSITLFGRDIEMDPITFTVVPKAPPGLDEYGDFLDTDEMSDGADEMISGTDDMLEGIDELLDGLNEMLDAAEDMQDGLNSLEGGAGDLEDAAAALASGAAQLAAKASDFCDGMSAFAGSFALFDQGMEELNTAVGQMTTTLQSLAEAAALLDAGVIGQSSGVGGVMTSNAELTTLAQAVAGSYPGADTAALAAGLAAQQTALDSLNAAGADLQTLSGSVNAGTAGFYTGFSTTFAGNVLALRNTSSTLYAACLELLTGAQALSDGCAALASSAASLKTGAAGLADGIGEAADGVPDLIDALGEMIEGVTELRDGVEELQTEGLVEMQDLLDGLDGYLGKLEVEAAAYQSFMDERNAPGCSVQFLLKTNGIRKPEQQPEPEPEPTQPKGFFEKLFDLF